ncbi:MAG TPA: hypothetical protein VKB51_03335 [bacterium]|nr:hypothetical protein [bacterium]
MNIRYANRFGWWLAMLVAGTALALVPVVVLAADMKPLSAGIGVEGRQPHPDYPLKLVFATTKGEYLADVNVSVYDTSGKEVMQAHSPGPWLYLDVPSGEYKVMATTKGGQKASAHVNVSGEGQTVVNLAWKMMG